MLDFKSIHPFKTGQRNSFEEFVCQLARLEVFPKGATFKRVEGSGGDGGVEAYWTKPNGRKTAYQAKYFLSSGEVKWDQIDDSVYQALDSHPEIEKFVVALPCDLTDKSGVKRKGKTGWEHFDSHKKKWLEKAKQLEIVDIVFEVWSESELLHKSKKRESEGLLEYFFGQTETSIDWFQQKCDEAISALDERFHPEDHVNIAVEELFSVISRTPKIKDHLQGLLGKIQTYNLPEIELKKLEKHPPQELISCLKKALSELLLIKSSVSLSPDSSWEIDEWLNRVRTLSIANQELREWYWDYKSTLDEKNSEDYIIRSCIRNSNDLASYLSDLKTFINSNYFLAENSGFAMIRGDAGSGKSHLLAKSLQNSLAQHYPAILILGQRLNSSDIWAQISQTLGLTTGSSANKVLGILDSAGKAAGVRTLLLVDAINEGPGARYWSNELAAFLENIKRFSHVCCVISCRSEYFQFAVPKKLLKASVVVDIHGFETPEEQLNASRIYLDRRGINRPSSPWLSSEFINPLFLRTVCLALYRNKQSEFPSGLSGTKKVLQYYLDSLGENITAREESSTSLVPRIARAVQSIAERMLKNRTDFVEVSECSELIDKHFSSKSPRSAADWLSVFLNNGILRKDPNPYAEDVFSDQEVVRFSFQRFQDFLMAEAALKKVESADLLFKQSGEVGFCINGNLLRWEWLGLIESLAVALPERFGIELVDSLPGGFDKWWESYGVMEAFAQSVMWREKSDDAFSNRTLELLNKYTANNPDRFELLIQISTSTAHPWNAWLITKNLKEKKLPERDAFWTDWVNAQSADDSYIGILIDWCRNGQGEHTKRQNQLLACLMLCWLFSSSNREIRDKATKALANVISQRPDIFPELLDIFSDVDDLYIQERLMASGFSACCLTPLDLESLKSYSQKVFELTFQHNSPPYSVLLRDYALGIIELASYMSALHESVDITLCRPPYNSPTIRFNVTEEKLTNISTRAGDRKIMDSCTSLMGDFSSYEIKPSVSKFLTTRLSKDVSLSTRQKLVLFEKEVVSISDSRINVFNKLKDTFNKYTYGLVDLSSFPDIKEPTAEKMRQWQKDCKEVEEEFLLLLEQKEAQRYWSEVSAYFHDDETKEDNKKFDQAKLARWVAKRAYDFGWTKERFGNELRRSHGYSRARPEVERIGKKYQWLALDELICRLADNFWLDDGYDSLPYKYSYPTDIGFLRDIEPTLLMDEIEHPVHTNSNYSWVFEPLITLESIAEEELIEWPFRPVQKGFAKNLPYRTDNQGQRWLLLYEHQSQTEKYSGSRPVTEHSLRRQEFRILSSIFVKRNQITQIAEHIREKEKVSSVDWTYFSSIDDAYYYEIPWRQTCNQVKWIFDSWSLPQGTGFAPLVTEMQWESHLDKSLPNGYFTFAPAPWMAKELSLEAVKSTPGTWCETKTGDIVFQTYEGEDNTKAVLLREDKFRELAGHEYTVLSLLIHESSCWPSGSNQMAAWRRTEGVYWEGSRGLKKSTWFEDHRNKNI